MEITNVHNKGAPIKYNASFLRVEGRRVKLQQYQQDEIIPY